MNWTPFQISTTGWGDGSVLKTPVAQAYRLEFRPQNPHKMLGGCASLPVIPELKTGASDSQDKLSNHTSPFCKF